MNNSMMSGTNNTQKQTIISREELLKVREQIASASLQESELKSLDDSIEKDVSQNKGLEVQEKRLIKVKTGLNRAGFIDALVLSFLTAIAGLASFLYMLFNIAGVLY